jgi:hypothetical protein
MQKTLPIWHRVEKQYLLLIRNGALLKEYKFEKLGFISSRIVSVLGTLMLKQHRNLVFQVTDANFVDLFWLLLFGM